MLAKTASNAIDRRMISMKRMPLLEIRPEGRFSSAEEVKPTFGLSIWFLRT